MFAIAASLFTSVWRISQHNNIRCHSECGSMDLWSIDPQKCASVPLRKWQYRRIRSGSGPAADRSEGIPKLFQHAAPKSPHRFPSSPDRPWTWSQLPCPPLPREWARRSGCCPPLGRRKVWRGETCGGMPERLHPSLQSSAKVANVS